MKQKILRSLAWTLAVTSSSLLPSVIEFLPQIPPEIPAHEKHIAIITTSYKNKDWYKQNLDSIFAQNYKNFELVYVDDHSPDGTGKLVEDYLHTINVPCKVTLIKNEQRMLAATNMYRAIHLVADDSIIITVDGDDFLPSDDTNVLAYVNTLYADPDVWLTYGRFKYWPGTKESPYVTFSDETIKNNTFRKHYPHIATHLRTYYAWLFKNIKLSELFINGSMITALEDLPMMFSMLEMAGLHSKPCPKLLYIYNVSRQLDYTHLSKNDSFIKNEEEIRNRKPYAPLDGPTIGRLAPFKNGHATILVYVNNSVEQAERSLTSLVQHAKGYETLCIVYNAEHEEKYASLKTKFPKASWIPYSAQALKQFVMQQSQQHLLITHDTHGITEELNLGECILSLEQTYAHAFYFNVDTTKLIKSSALDASLKAFQLMYGQANAHTSDWALYRTSTITDLLASSSPATFEEFEKLLATVEKQKPLEIGLFFNKQKITALHDSTSTTTSYAQPLQSSTYNVSELFSMSNEQILEYYGTAFGKNNYRTFYELARIFDNPKSDQQTWALALHLYLKAHTEKPYRAEPLLRIAQHYLHGNNPLAFLFAARTLDLPYPENEPDVEKDVYKYLRYDVVGICAWYVGAFEVGRKALEKALIEDPTNQHLKNNLAYYTNRTLFFPEDKGLVDINKNTTQYYI